MQLHLNVLSVHVKAQMHTNVVVYHNVSCKVACKCLRLF